jgi:hypothetical protein|tara:strand:- start:1099 stop:1383 length:285 start_codon:yes stop_codon:yes gene_type:complete
MGASTTMEKRGHHICKMVNYEVRQKITKETSKRIGGKLVKTPGNSEVMIYKRKSKIEGGMTDIKLAAQKVYNILKKEGKNQLVDKKLIRRYSLV